MIKTPIGRTRILIYRSRSTYFQKIKTPIGKARILIYRSRNRYFLFWEYKKNLEFSSIHQI